MSDVVPIRENVALAATQFRAAVSESLAQTLGGVNNFINYFQHSEKQFFLNGDYSLVLLPQLGADGLVVFEFNAQIIDVWMFSVTAGTSGTTELDLKLATTSGGSFTSIFTTTPKISYNAGDYAWVGAVDPSVVGPLYNPSPPYSAPTGTVAPVLNTALTTSVPAWSALRVDLLQAQVQGQNTGILVHYRPV